MSNNAPVPDIAEFVKHIEIRYLVHFTRIENLASILEHGLLPRQELESRGISFTVTDALRKDERLDASCLSISFPNWRMFYSYRKSQENSQWIVITIDPSTLWKRDCAFFEINAAKSYGRQVPINERKGLDALRRLFDEQYQDENGRMKQRSELQIPSWFTTNPQAEVLVFGSITTDDFLEVNFEKPQVKQEWLTQNPNTPRRVKFAVQKHLFKPRGDWRFWQAQVAHWGT